MTRIARSAALLAMTLCALPRPALATDTCKVTPIIRLPVTMEGPRASVAVRMNGKDSRIWLDSGAFFNFMSKAKAVELGLTTEALPPGFYAIGIGGSYTPELGKVRDFGLLGAQLHNVKFLVGGSDSGNGFLGANLLGAFDAEFDLAKGSVNLFRSSGCAHSSMAYWAPDGGFDQARLLSPENPNDRHIYIEVFINGHALRAVLDTGAPDTIVYRSAAKRVGIDLASPKVVASMHMSGLGSHARQSWIARTETVAIGGETIRNSPIRVVDEGGMGTDDMLLGVDFLISHHIYVSQSTRKVSLTYNGGPIFSATTDGEFGHQETRAVNINLGQAAAEPTTADQFAGRASGRLMRDDVNGAVTDYTAAIKLAPARTDLLNGRANAYMRNGHLDLAVQDIDAALKIAPTDHRLLLWRARARLARGDRTGALADTDAAAANTPKGSLDIMQVVIIYERLGKADRGLALLDPVIALHHDDSAYPRLLNARAWDRALANVDLDLALKDADAAIRKSGPDSALLDTRTLVQLRRKAYPAAIADATAALAKAPKSASTLFFRGLARIASGDETGGLADITAARAIRPKIDAQFAGYGLTAPKSAPSSPAQPEKPDGTDDETDQ